MYSNPIAKDSLNMDNNPIMIEKNIKNRLKTPWNLLFILNPALRCFLWVIKNPRYEINNLYEEYIEYKRSGSVPLYVW